MQCGLIGEGELVGSHGQTAPLLEPIDTPFDGVALLVCLSVEAGRATTGATSSQAVSDLVGGLWHDGMDPTPAEMPADRRGRVGAVRKGCLWPSTWSSGSGSRHPEPGHDCLEGWRVTGLTCGDVECQRASLAVADQMDLSAQTTAGASECVVVRFSPTGHPLLTPFNHTALAFRRVAPWHPATEPPQKPVGGPRRPLLLLRRPCERTRRWYP